MKRLYIFWALFLVQLSAYASWDGTVAGKISTIDVVPINGENFGFRVSLVGNQALCGNSNAWAYINKSDDNYQTAVSVLLAAKMSEKEVVLYSNQATNNYCHIGYVSLR